MLKTLIIVGLYVVKMAIIVNGGSRSNNQADGTPKFSQSIQNVSSVVGKDAILDCYVESLGIYKVGWMRSDQTVLSIGKIVTQSSRYSVRHENSNRWSLRIHNVRESDEGCYICQINTQPLLKQSGCIQLQFPPDISDEESSSDTTIQEGRDATLRCTAKGNPTPRIFWRRDNGHSIRIRTDEGAMRTVDIFNGSSLSLFNVKRDQMSAYLCIAVNGVEPAISKRILLHVQFAPNITTDTMSTLHTLEEGESQRIDCLVESFPAPMSYWVKESHLQYRNDVIQRVLEQSEKYKIQEEKISQYKTRMILTINNLEVHDAGSYVCVSGNMLGSSNHTIRISEVRLTTTTTPSTTTTERTTTTTETTTTLRITTTPRRRVFIPFTSSTSSSSEPPTTAYDLMPTEYQIEFVTDYPPGSDPLYYSGVGSYSHHINYINSQPSCNDICRPCRWIFAILFIYNILRLRAAAASTSS